MTLRTLRSFRLLPQLGLAGLLLAPVGAASQSSDWEAWSEQAFRELKTKWPEVSAPEIVEGATLEVRDGRARLGHEKLAELASAEANGADHSLLYFYLAHEAWHGVQVAKLLPASFQEQRLNRMLECEADYMAASAAAERQKAAGRSRAEGLRAASAVGTYVRLHSRGSQEAQFYPSAEMRAVTIQLAWQQAIDPVVEWAPSLNMVPLTKDTLTLAREVCRLVTNQHDGSIGNITIREQRDEEGEGSATTGERRLRIQNYGVRPVRVDFMLIADAQVPADFAEGHVNEIVEALRDFVVVPPRSHVDRSFRISDRSLGSPSYVIVRLPYASGIGPTDSLVATQYADASTNETEPCYTRLQGLDSSRDRATVARLATIALAANEDFRPIASPQPPTDSGSDRSYRLLSGLGSSIHDRINVRLDPWGSGPRVSYVAFESNDGEAIVAEYVRLKQVMALLCGPDRVKTERFPNDHEITNITGFAPKAFVQLRSHVFDKDTGGGGIVAFSVARDFSW